MGSTIQRLAFTDSSPVRRRQMLIAAAVVAFLLAHAFFGWNGRVFTKYQKEIISWPRWGVITAGAAACVFLVTWLWCWLWLRRTSEEVPPERAKRNAPCWCGSAKKYERCHLRSDEEAALKERIADGFRRRNEASETVFGEMEMIDRGLHGEREK